MNMSNRVRKIPLKESDIQKQIRDYLNLQGWYVVKIHQSLGSVRGIADLYAIKNGHSVWIEVKTPQGHQSDDQILFQWHIEGHGGIYLLAHGIPEVEQFLKERGY